MFLEPFTFVETVFMKYWLSLVIFFSVISVTAQNVGIGTSSPAARLHVTDSAVLFTGPVSVPASTLFAPPASGSGTRMMWYPEKAAFRAGNVIGSQWDKDFVGNFSTAFGYSTTASGIYSFGAGYGPQASGYASIAFGNLTQASGLGSTSLGNQNSASGFSSASMGYLSRASGFVSTAIGQGLVSKSSSALAIGSYNDTSFSNRLFEIGNGTEDNARRNALTVLQNGNMGLGIVLPAARLHVADSAVLFTGPASVATTTAFAPPASGSGVRMMWYPQKAAFRAGGVSGTQWDKDNIGIYSIAMGVDARASGNYSCSIGAFNSADGEMSVALGNGTLAIGLASLATGINTEASGVAAFTSGFYTRATGSASTVMGFYTRARSQNSLVIGQYNDTTTTNRLFEVGNGSADNARSNAFTVLTNGNTGIGMVNPTNPLSFPPTLQKKISFYPGATGDVGISVSGNDLRIYSDNVNARVSFGYDSYTSGFISRAFVPASGTNALVVQGNLLVNGTSYSSDARFKQNIRPLTGSLEKILALQGVQYEMRVKEFPGRNFQPGTEIGLIAQEVEKVFPELVGTDTEGYKSVDYAKLVPLLIESVKTQQVQLQKQEEQVRLQQEKIDQLLLRLEKLERSVKQQ